MDIPIAFQQKIINCFKDEGQKWLSTLECRLKEIAENWNLTLGNPVTNLSYNYVLTVFDKTGETYILKMGLPGVDFQNEVKAIQQYNGEGCARLVRVDVNLGAMQLEKIQPGEMLSTVNDELLVIEQFCQVWKKIRRPLLKGDSFPLINDWATTLTKYSETPIMSSQIPHEWARIAASYMHEIMESTDEIELLHGDLHHENILYSEQRGWLAIDPKGVAGDSYFDIIPFLVNHLFTKQNPEKVLKLRVDSICELLNLDRQKLLKAAIALSTVKACWSIEENDPYWKEMFQCGKWFDEMLGLEEIQFDEVKLENLE